MQVPPKLAAWGSDSKHGVLEMGRGGWGGRGYHRVQVAGLRGHYTVRRPELGVVDGGHRLNCLCYLLDSRDDNGAVFL
jgi:hypothetical protein